MATNGQIIYVRRFNKNDEVIIMSDIDKAIKEIRELREYDEEQERLRKYNKWFKSLSPIRRSDLALNFWSNASIEEKQSQYSMRDL